MGTVDPGNNKTNTSSLSQFKIRKLLQSTLSCGLGEIWNGNERKRHRSDQVKSHLIISAAAPIVPWWMPGYLVDNNQASLRAWRAAVRLLPMQCMHSWGRGRSTQSKVGLRGPQSEGLVEAEDWRGLAATPFCAATGRTPASIYQGLLNTPGPKIDGQSHRVPHKQQQSGHQLRTHRATHSTAWTYTGGEPPWSCCQTKWVTLAVGQTSWDTSRGSGSVPPGGSQARAGRDWRRGRVIVVWRLLWRRLEDRQKRKYLLQGNRGRRTQVSMERNFIKSRGMRMGSWRSRPEKKERGKKNPNPSVWES